MLEFFLGAKNLNNMLENSKAYIISLFKKPLVLPIRLIGFW